MKTQPIVDMYAAYSVYFALQKWFSHGLFAQVASHRNDSLEVCYQKFQQGLLSFFLDESFLCLMAIIPYFAPVLIVICL